MDNEAIKNCVSKANEIIEQEAKVTTYEDEKRKGFRWCKVNDFPPIPCGGVHINNAKEIGKINFLKEEREGMKQKILLEVE